LARLGLYWRNTEYFGGGWLIGWLWVVVVARKTRGILKIPKVTELAPKFVALILIYYYTVSVEMGVLGGDVTLNLEEYCLAAAGSCWWRLLGGL